MSEHGFGLDREGDRTRFDWQQPTMGVMEFGPTGPNIGGFGEAATDQMAAAFAPNALPTNTETQTAVQAANPRDPRKAVAFADQGADAGKT